ncbi:MAG: pilus assembly protein TadG-related protein [Chloroflexia bacterium]
MYDFPSFRSKGQSMVLVALAAVALVAFVALAVDGGNAYALRRQAQNAADGAAIAGTWTLVDISGFDAIAQILRSINTYAQANGIRDTNGDPADTVNANVQAWFVDRWGNRVSETEMHGMTTVPAGAKGVEVETTITNTTFFARAIGIHEVGAKATATAVFIPAGGILPIAVNQYWQGSQGHCPYAHCGEPYSFVRNPNEPPPFTKISVNPEIWQRNFCANPANNNICQGPYQGYGENFGKAFALLGQDAKPNYGSMEPRSAVELDYRYDALRTGGLWHYLVSDDIWQDNVSPIADGQGKAAMEEVLQAGGYSKRPLPAVALEPPPEHIEQWDYCWGSPPGPNTCFNFPATGRSRPYEVLQFLSGTAARFLAQAMYDDGNYRDGRYAPGERIAIMVYNGATGDQWGTGGKKSDSAVVVGYFGAVIVGYGNNFNDPCSGTPGNWQSYTHCLTGQPTTVYGIADASAPLMLDPTPLIEEFLPKQIVLIE